MVHTRPNLIRLLSVTVVPVSILIAVGPKSRAQTIDYCNLEHVDEGFVSQLAASQSRYRFANIEMTRNVQGGQYMVTLFLDMDAILQEGSGGGSTYALMPGNWGIYVYDMAAGTPAGFSAFGSNPFGGNNEFVETFDPESGDVADSFALSNFGAGFSFSITESNQSGIEGSTTLFDLAAGSTVETIGFPSATGSGNLVSSELFLIGDGSSFSGSGVRCAGIVDFRVVPEPSSIAICGWIGAATLLRRRR